MTLTLILIAIGALLFLVIIYNIVQQYWQKQEAEKRKTLFKHKIVINETEELLQNSGNLPYSQALVHALYQRILHSLQEMQRQEPKNAQIKSRLTSIEHQLQQVKDNYPKENATLKAPESDQHAIQMLQIIKRLRLVIRGEHSRGKLSNPTFVAEDRRLEHIRLKINLINLAKRSGLAIANKDNNTARQMLKKGLNVLEQIPDKDEQLKNIENSMQNKLAELTSKLKEVEKEQLAREEENEKSELDQLFEPKKKW